MKHIPQLRFPEFDKEWLSESMGKVYDFKVTNSFSRDDLNEQNGEVKNIHYGDIHKKFPTQLDLSKSKVPYIKMEKSIERISIDNYCLEGDMIFADASEDINDVGKAIEVINTNNEKLLSGLHTILARPDLEKISIGFGAYLFKSVYIRTQIQKESQGTKVLSISATRLAGVNLIFPEDETEQQKIASFFSAIDAKIQALQKKKDLLEEYKKGVAQKLFSQELRFKDDTGKEFPKWSKKDGNEVFDSVSNKNHNSDLPILAITQEHGAIPRDLIDFKITVSDKSIDSYKVVEKGDFIISLRSFQGGIEYSNYKGICSPAYIVLKPKIKIHDTFFKFYFKTPEYIKELNKKLEGIRDGKMISYKYFSEIQLPYPSPEEQKKISDFISQVDQKINTISQQLTEMEDWKKGLLQKMFC